MDATMKKMLERMIKDFNLYSGMVALSYEWMKEGKCDEGMLQWNKGSMNRIEEYMKELAEALDVKLEYEYVADVFGYDDWKRVLEYRMVRAAQYE